MIYKFGTFEFDTGSGELRRNGRLVSLEPQPAKVLDLLLSRAGEVVSRADLRHALWGSDTHVDFDSGLAYCMAQIRAALGDSGDNPRFVQTIPKRGYKFIAPVESNASPAAVVVPRRSIVWPATLAVLVLITIGSVVYVWSGTDEPQVAIAVSIFDNETGVAEFDRRVATLSDLVVEHLTKVDSRLAIIGNAAPLRQPRNIRNLKAVAAAVDADYVLLGQLQEGESGLRFITHFIRLEDGKHLKANRLDVAPDLNGLEDAVVREFDRAVRVHIQLD